MHRAFNGRSENPFSIKIGTPALSSFRKVEGKNVLQKIDTEEIIWTVRQLLPRESIDAIIDCAVEEAVRRIKEEGGKK